MKAAIIAVGSEMLGATRLDTNSLVLSGAMERHGIPVVRKMIVGDDHDRIAADLDYALQEASLVLITGGLGPTEDDVTKKAVATALGLELVLDESVLKRIEGLFEARGMRMPAVNRKQAEVFRGHEIVPNARGTAPGFHLSVDRGGSSRHVWIFPGVPDEMQGMVETDFEPWLRTVQRQSFYRRVVKIAGLTESAVEEMLQPFYAEHPGEPFTILASHGEIQIHLETTGGAEDGSPELSSMEQRLREIFGDRIYGLDDETLELVVGRTLLERGETVSAAESCTGGLLSSRLTDVSGSSSWFMGAVVSYSREAKVALLQVDPESIREHGEVSESVAIQMAAGVRERFGTSWGVAITGIAGPTGGTDTKPVGTVHVAIAGPETSRHKRFLFTGSRRRIKFYSSQMALDMLRRAMLVER